MCGFYGAIGHDAVRVRESDLTLSRMLTHRGPDDAGFAEGEGWALGFRRLSILDLTPSGHQPMSSADQRYWLVSNGEIYNYIELRHELEKKGERFAGSSDTEVLLKLLACEGHSALTKLNGMFAFVFLDLTARRFIIARDRLGVKPLYFCHRNGGLRFASELKALLAWPDADRTVDPAALAEYLSVNYLPAEMCIFRGYAKLPPATYLTGSLDQPLEAEPIRYWDVRLNDDGSRTPLTQRALDELGALVADATRIRLRSDVPVGVFLSGGIDSGLVAAYAAREQTAEKPLALTVAFDEQEYDESELAAATAAFAGLSHRFIRQRPAGVALIDELAWYFDEPFGDASALPTFMLCKAAAEHGKVFLSGDGGDEAFGGYRRYSEARRYKGVARALTPVRHLGRAVAAQLSPLSALRYRIAKTLLPDEGYAAAFDGVPNDPVLSAVAGEMVAEALPHAGTSIWKRWEETRGGSLLARQQRLDFTHYLPDDILVKVDRASMAHSIEVRSPFLDYRIVEWAARLPRSVMLNGAMGKLPLRALAARVLPKNVQQGEKRGFGVPLDDWFRTEEGRAFVADRLLSERARSRGWWNGETVRRILVMHASGRGREFGALLWRLLMLDAWARYYVDDSSFLKGVRSAKA